MWQTLYYIVGAGCAVALTGYFLASDYLKRQRKNRAQCEMCENCTRVDRNGKIDCQKADFWIERPRYCGKFRQKLRGKKNDK